MEPGRDSLALFKSPLMFPSLAVLAHVDCLSGIMHNEGRLNFTPNRLKEAKQTFQPSFCDTKGKLHRKARL